MCHAMRVPHNAATVSAAVGRVQPLIRSKAPSMCNPMLPPCVQSLMWSRHHPYATRCVCLAMLPPRVQPLIWSEAPSICHEMSLCVRPLPSACCHFVGSRRVMHGIARCVAHGIACHTEAALSSAAVELSAAVNAERMLPPRGQPSSDTTMASRVG